MQEARSSFGATVLGDSTFVAESVFLMSGSIEAAAASNTGEVWSLQP